jgi:hypothetical protein
MGCDHHKDNDIIIVTGLTLIALIALFLILIILL